MKKWEALNVFTKYVAIYVPVDFSIELSISDSMLDGIAVDGSSRAYNHALIIKILLLERCEHL